VSDIELERKGVEDLPPTRRLAVDDEALEVARGIVEDVRKGGERAVRDHAERLGDIDAGEDLYLTETELEAARDEVAAETREVLERSAGRIERFAEAQRESIDEIETEIPGGRAGHRVAPVGRAGCYAPGGRYPLPSSVLMTVVTARAAGVETVWLAAPTATPVVRAAASIAGADGMLKCGGAQAIAAMAYGSGPVPPSDVVVGPGSRWVTAAKKVISGPVRIDMLAGPSELVVLADDSADPETVASDLLAQAEHDVEALPALVSTEASLVENVERALEKQLGGLPTAETAAAALENGFAVVVEGLDEGIEVCDRIAPEHLEVLVERAGEIADRFDHYGALFVGGGSAEVLGDYGAGPNHTLPTGGTARSTGGLSVLTFLRVRTWIEIDDPEAAELLARDAADFARLESLEAHARSALRRLGGDSG